ncbi:ATP-binding cassette domain-containing protein [Neobacillus thermocopriae]|uniref:ATP-binding cassette domain-containing protein n=1 Tax=Neobacillus thermocopriae TaxID=1215031 RepID=A0A6B3TR14_9BACI|nr:ATP-binding cassette domain-containing protein [Neobacillus thermocopriae]MED3623050.1 ATP-binding cassette domain-containing protein [Neobacillus thermocopriae]MED3714945.1 ATP-binding cassette domain-containing protein [Neobacillus thermocopriae]NEX78799.1 ATP-binding cassette domain-containing protein [Neobacillus thermocopriae]
MLYIKDLDYSIDENIILEHLSFTIPEEEVTAIVGPNGVGKTTTVQLLAGILQSKNESVKKLLLEKKVVYLDLEYLVFDELTAKEFISLIADYNNKTKLEVRTILSDFEPMNISSFLNTKLKGLSLGQKQKLIILTGFLSNADVLIFDEPFNGLDYKSERFFKTLLRDNKYRFTIIITTHNFTDIETYTNKCIVMKNKNTIIEIDNSSMDTYREMLYTYLDLEQEA